MDPKVETLFDRFQKLIGEDGTTPGGVYQALGHIYVNILWDMNFDR